MKVGYMPMFPSLHADLTDAEMLRAELRIAAMTEAAGYDAIGLPEHHFDEYSMCVDNLQTLIWLAAKTEHIELGSAALILPWWSQPLRLAEKISTMDAIAPGRYLIGFGRGLSRMEYDTFGILMHETRERFDEAARMIVGVIQTGFIESAGPFYPQKRTEIRPRPRRDLKNRLYAVAMSAESAKAIAVLDCRMMTFVQLEMERHLPNIELFRCEYRRNHRQEPGPTLLIDFSYCDQDSGRAEEVARTHLATNYLSILKHYEFMEGVHKDIKGYEDYAQASAFLHSLGLEKTVEDYVAHQAWGTPQQILDTLERRRAMIGDFEWISLMSFGGMPFDRVEKSMRLLAQEVLPEVQSWGEVRAARARLRASLTRRRQVRSRLFDFHLTVCG